MPSRCKLYTKFKSMADLFKQNDQTEVIIDK